nr:zinc transporter ZTP29 [Tanacetum cinerariifolium]
ALLVILTKAPNLKMLGLLQFFGGVIFFAIIANFIPEPSLAPMSDSKSKKKHGDEGGKDIMKKHRRQVLFSGIITAVGISLHNFPEGMAVFLGSLKLS